MCILRCKQASNLDYLIFDIFIFYFLAMACD